MNSQKKLNDIKVSIITPCYNAENYIQKAFQSVTTQTHENFEWIIIDDCSTDSSQRIISQLEEKDRRIKFSPLKTNSGAASARNKAIEISTGEYLAFLDIDDQWLPEKLKESLEFMTVRKTNFSYHSYKKLRNGVTGKEIRVPSKVNRSDLLKSCSITTSTVVIKRETIGSTRMRPELRRGQDYVFWLDLLKGNTAHGFNMPLTLYQIGNKSLSSNKLKKASSQWKILNNYTDLPLPHKFFNFILYSIFGLIKYSKK